MHKPLLISHMPCGTYHIRGLEARATTGFTDKDLTLSATAVSTTV